MNKVTLSHHSHPLLLGTKGSPNFFEIAEFMNAKQSPNTDQKIFRKCMEGEIGAHNLETCGMIVKH